MIIYLVYLQRDLILLLRLNIQLIISKNLVSCIFIYCDPTILKTFIIIMALADVCGLKTNQLKNGFLSDFGGTSTHLLNDALTTTNSFTIPYGIDVREQK